jgi:cytochrome b6-f complex iron-sulfur subunit
MSQGPFNAMQDDHKAGCTGCGAAGESMLAGEGIGRRTFLAQGAMLAAMAALAACGVASDSFTAPSLTSSTTIKVSDYPALASVGGIALVTISGSPFAIVRTGSSSFVSLSRVCPHQSSIVNVSGSGFLCPNHGAQFNSSGTWIGGQGTSNLHSYATTYDSVAGTITVG